MDQHFVEIAKWAGRKSITRVIPTDKNSPYVAISLLTKKVGDDTLIGYMDTTNEHEGDIRFGYAPLPITAMPMFSVTKLNYRQESLGTRVLAASRHMVEDKDTIFVAIDSAAAYTPTALNVDEKPVEGIVVLGKWRSQRENGETVYFGDGGAVPLEGVVDTVIVSALEKEAKRINKNEPAVDTRVAFWNNDENDVTAYGKFKAQTASDRKARAASKK